MLSDGGRNYANIEKEGSALVFAVKNCTSTCMGIVSEYSWTISHCWDCLQNTNLLPLPGFNDGLSSWQYITMNWSIVLGPSMETQTASVVSHLVHKNKM